MNITQTEIRIIESLLIAKDFVSSYDLSKQVGITRRSLRSEMKNVKKIIDDFGLTLESKSSAGYLIKGKDAETYEKLHQYLDESKQDFSDASTIMYRQTYIARKLIESDDYVKIDNLAEEMHVGRSTISTDIKEIKKRFKKYNLTFVQKPHYGMKAIGNELTIRECINDVLFDVMKESNMFSGYLDAFLNKDFELENGIIKILQKNEINLSDTSLTDFLISLATNTDRILTNHPLNDTRDTEFVLDTPEYKTAKTIAKHFKRKAEFFKNYNFSEEEIRNLAIELICKKTTRYDEIKKVDRKIEELVKKILIEANQITNNSFTDSSFKRMFYLHIEQTICRALNQEKKRGSIDEKEVIDNFPICYRLGKLAKKHIEEFLGYSIDEAEVIRIALQYTNMMQARSIKNVLFVAGQAMTSLATLEHFDARIRIKKIVNYTGLEKEDLSKYDFIISTIFLNKEYSIPHINISPIIKQSELNDIENYLNYNEKEDSY